MALPDLTGQNIEDTYQRIVQWDGIQFYDGTGSLVPLGASSQSLQQVTETGAVTTIPITGSIFSASGDVYGNTGSFQLIDGGTF